MSFLGGAMAIIILGTGCYLTIKTGFFQFSHLFRSLAQPFEKQKDRCGVTAFQAMATALGSSIGTANIAGVAGAICLGGPGAVFWMWLAGLFGMASKLCEIVLAMKYRDASAIPPKGGAMYYMERGLGKPGRILALCFSIFGTLAALIGTALVQSNTIAGASFALAKSLGFTSGGSVLKLCIGILASLLTGTVIFGGAARIGRFSERAVPFMAAGYALICIVVIGLNAQRLPGAIRSIVCEAFSIKPAVSGAAGICAMKALRVGVARGVYSNEAGVGSSTMAHTGSSETDPVKQGMTGIFEVFADTLVMCTLTALVILTSGINVPYGSAAGAELAGAAFASALGERFSSAFLSASVWIFAFTSLVGWSLYGERCAAYVFGSGSAVPFRALFLLLIPVGSIINIGICWKLGELFNYLMAVPNLAALILLSGNASNEVRAYKMFEKSKRKGYNKG